MGQASAKLREWAHEGQRGFNYFCQGCEGVHGVRVVGPGAWGWNGSLDRPTFTPSVLTTYEANPDADEEFKEWRTQRTCHTFITDGRVQFLDDCTHPLAGQTHDLPDLPVWMRD